jgi:hypothetical protein
LTPPNWRAAEPQPGVPTSVKREGNLFAAREMVPAVTPADTWMAAGQKRLTLVLTERPGFQLVGQIARDEERRLGGVTRAD